MSRPRSRFLILTQYYPPETGAPQVRLSAFARALRQRGYQVTVVTAMPNYPEGRVHAAYRGSRFVREMVDGIPVVRTWIRPSEGTSVAGRLASYLSFTLSSILGVLRAGRADVVFVESPPLFLGTTGVLAARIKGALLVLNVSDLWPASAEQLGIVTNPKLLRLGRRLEGFVYAASDRICGVTEGIVARLLEDGVPQSKVFFFPNGVDLDVFSPASDVKPTNGVARFVYAGTHGQAQGLDVIVEAARLLRDRSDIEFVFVGDGPDKSRVRALADSYRLSNVAFEDPRPVVQMPDLFRSARASLVPLRNIPLFEGARPSKILPSIACGTPVIYGGYGEGASLVAGNGCGVAVPPEDPSALAAAVRTLADDPAAAAAMGAAGRKLAEERFGWDRILGRWLEEMRIETG